MKTRQERHKEKLKDAGLVRVTVWVPGNRAGDLKRLAAGFRKYITEGNGDGRTGA